MNMCRPPTLLAVLMATPLVVPPSASGDCIGGEGCAAFWMMGFFPLNCFHRVQAEAETLLRLILSD